MSDTVDIANDVVIPKPQNFEIAVVQIRVSRRIATKVWRHGVLAAIDFDHQTRRIADKIDNELINRRLPTEMKTFAF